MGRVSHYGVLVLRDLGAQEDPGPVLDVEDPQLAGHVSCRVDLPSVHVDLALEETAERSLVSLEAPAALQVPPQREVNKNPPRWPAHVLVESAEPAATPAPARRPRYLPTRQLGPR